MSTYVLIFKTFSFFGGWHPASPATPLDPLVMEALICMSPFSTYDLNNSLLPFPPTEKNRLEKLVAKKYHARNSLHILRSGGSYKIMEGPFERKRLRYSGSQLK